MSAANVKNCSLLSHFPGKFQTPGLKWSSRNVTFNLAAYWYDYKGLQLEDFQGLAAVQANADAEIFGVDFDGQWRINEHWEVRGGGSILPDAHYTTYENAVAFGAINDAAHLIPFPQEGYGIPSQLYSGTGKRMIKAPEFTGFATLTYNTDLSFGKLESNVNIYYSSQYFWDASYTFATDAYFLIGAQVSLKPNFLPNTKFTIYGKNLTNTVYTQGNLTDGEALMRYFSPPMQIGARVQYSF